VWPVHRRHEVLELGGGDDDHPPASLAGEPGCFRRVPRDQTLAHGQSAEGAEDLTSLSDPRVREAGGVEVGDPVLEPSQSEGVERLAAQMRENVGAQEGLVSGPGLRLQVGQGLSEEGRRAAMEESSARWSRSRGRLQTAG
jgi:hypothetical protein